MRENNLAHVNWYDSMNFEIRSPINSISQISMCCYKIIKKSIMINNIHSYHIKIQYNNEYLHQLSHTKYKVDIFKAIYTYLFFFLAMCQAKVSAVLTRIGRHASVKAPSNWITRSRDLSWSRTFPPFNIRGPRAVIQIRLAHATLSLYWPRIVV
jgi:hypothetical protein